MFYQHGDFFVIFRPIAVDCFYCSYLYFPIFLIMLPIIPYNTLPALPPPQDLETVPLLKAVAGAARALGELKGVCQTLPNPALLINTIALQESKASSAIENIITTHDELYQAVVQDHDVMLASGTISPSAKEVLRYREALYAGYNELQERNLLTTNLFIRLMQTIKQNSAGIRRESGVYIKNQLTGEIVYTPPEGESVIRQKLYELEQFIHDESNALNPIIRMALLHYQFEAIHPFADGNGRTGRILMVLYLVQQDFLDLPILFLSSYIIKHKARYYELLRAVTEREAWQEWCLFMAKAVEETARLTLNNIRRIRTAQDDITERARNGMKRGFSKELIDIIFEHPYCKIQSLTSRNLAQRQTASAYLQDLSALGILAPLKIGREIYYINTALMQILSASEGE